MDDDGQRACPLRAFCLTCFGRAEIKLRAIVCELSGYKIYLVSFFSMTEDEDWNCRFMAAIILVLSVMTLLSVLVMIRVDCLYDPD